MQQIASTRTVICQGVQQSQTVRRFLWQTEEAVSETTDVFLDFGYRGRSATHFWPLNSEMNERNEVVGVQNNY